MLKNESLKKYIDELIDEVQKELDESNVTGNVDGYFAKITSESFTGFVGAAGGNVIPDDGPHKDQLFVSCTFELTLPVQ